MGTIAPPCGSNFLLQGGLAQMTCVSPAALVFSVASNQLQV
jgi:hypothetical protein